MSYMSKILIVDDEPRMCDSLKALLSGQSYDIHTGNSGREAIEYLAGNNFDLVLLDMVMPDMDGFQVMDYIERQSPDTLVIVITGHASTESAVKALRSGANDYLTKPFEHEELLKTVKNAIDQKRLKSERKGAQEERKKLETQLRQAHKMEAIGTLAGGIAHDFNNLLMGIQGNISLMLLDIDPTHPHYERLRNIQKQVQSGARLTSHLLGYARKGRYEVKPIDLNQLVEETSETFGRTRKEIAIHRELAEDLFAIEADHVQIEQVLLNLFINAADAMPGGGNLILKTMNVDHNDMRGKLYDPKPGNYVLLMITDTGMGMDKETLERIFDPFFTTKEMGRGTGLGLASVYGIVKGHGGYVDVDSKEKHGATFSMFLPASKKKVRKPVKGADRVIKGSGTVLLVDDEEVILEVSRDLLKAMGYRVLLAKDGKEALEIFKKNQDVIDIVVLDMVMPNMGGGVAYDSMKEIKPDIKVLLSSGFSVDGEATEILERGCDGFIQKPFTMKKLSAKIREILEKK